jgi:membrane protease YdiL (CAAX protease family)
MQSSFRFQNLRFNWQLGISLILLFGIPRFLLVMAAVKSGSFNYVSIVFLVMALTPFVLLTKMGRKQIGIKKVEKPIWLLYSLLLGMLISIGIYTLGAALYGATDSNWYVHISQPYQSMPLGEMSGVSKAIYFTIFSFIAMTISPIGEELLYRGLIHESFVSKFGQNKASVIDSIAFAVVHIAHFGLVFSAGGWSINWILALLWMGLMYISSRLFFYCRLKSGSILGAILSHAGFNLAMTYFIFYWIL